MKLLQAILTCIVCFIFSILLTDESYAQISIENIGTTTYDFQTNGSTCRRLHYGLDGALNATWTMSFMEAETGWPDRGTGYNRYEDGAWMPAPEETIEEVRTGWGNLLSFDDGTTGVLAHTGTQLIYTQKVGFGWQSNLIPQTFGEDPSWARVGQDGDIINVICTNGNDGLENGSALMFNRSEDQGALWQGFSVIQEVYEHYPFYPPGAANKTVYGDSYAMDTDGDVIAFVLGDFGRQTVLFKSINGGQTWNATVITSTTDPFELDPSQFESTWCAGDLSLLLDDDGMAHVAFNGIWNSYNESQNEIVYSPAHRGLFYWNEIMGSNNIQHVPGTFAMDLDEDGTNVIPFFNENPGILLDDYGPSLIGHTSLGLGDDGVLYLAYDDTREVSASDPDLYFRDVYIMKFDGEWHGPLNISNSDTTEDVFPHLPRRISACEVPVLFQSDVLPSTMIGLQTDQTINDINVAWIDCESIVDPAYIPANNPPLATTDLIDFTISVGCNFTLDDLGVEILDFPDGLLNNAATNLEGVDLTTAGVYDGYFITTDSDGNQIIDTVEVTVLADEIAPQLSIVEDTIFWDLGSPFDPLEDLDFIISDEDSYCYSSETINVEGEVDYTVPGICELIITAIDGAGNVSEPVNVFVLVGYDNPPFFPITFIVDGMEYEDGEVATVEGGLNLTQSDILEIVIEDAIGFVVDVTGEVDPTTLGEYIIIVEVEDVSGNYSVFTITIVIVDTTLPELSAASTSYTICLNEEFPVDPSDLESLFQLSDNFIEEGDYSGVSFDASAVKNDEAGQYPVTYNATDQNGNMSMLIITYIVLEEDNEICIDDNIAPTIMFLYIGSEVTEVTVEGGIGEVFSGLEILVEDDTDLNPIIEGPIGSVDMETVGQYELFYTATDFSENRFETSIIVTVTDETAPMFELKGESVLRVCEGYGYICGIAPDELDSLFTLSDNFIPANSNLETYISYDESSVDYFTAGDYMLTYTATDPNGLTTDRSVLITVHNDAECWVGCDANWFGVEDNNLSNKILLSPNPTNGNTVLSVDESWINSDLAIFDITGKKVKTMMQIQARTTNLDLSRFAGGLYYLHIRSENKTAVKKIVIK